MRSFASFVLASVLATSCWTWALPQAPPQPPSAQAGGPADAGRSMDRGGSGHNLPTEIASSIFYLSAGLLAGTGIKQFSHMLRGRPDLEHMFAPGQLSRLGRLEPQFSWNWHTVVSEDIVRAVRLNGDLLPAVHAYQHASGVERQRILYVMVHDEDFMTCVFQEMGKPVPTEEHPDWNFIDAEFFFAAQVCERTGRRRYGLRFPRVADYVSSFSQSNRWNEAAIKERVRERRSSSFSSASSSSNAFRQVLPHQLHALSKVISRVPPTVRRMEAVLERLPLAKVEAEVESRALAVERHF
ncbi:MAG: hypothetical protein M1826_006235 [Phylliscum demangeonii]|nr:MAG: hypothetical protein M1826_006235 [Phylliscum demangeonii]